MSGTPAITFPIVRPFGNQSLTPTDPGGVTLPIPVDSQIGVLAGAASFDDGFPAQTMVDPETQGGVNPFGQDVNGILFMLSVYCAMLQAGQRATYNSDAATAFNGYAVGAQLDSIDTPGRVWTNWLDGNENDPDSDSSHWAANDPLVFTPALAPGANNNIILPGPSDFAVEVDTTAGAINITGFIAQRNGQQIYISCTGSNLLQVLAENAGSDADNRIRMATDMGAVELQTFTLKYFSGINRWLAI